jgi:phenylalanyl-tRNA synthetase beta chain
LKVPVSWLREYVPFDWPVERLAAKLVFTSCEVDRVVERGVPDLDGNLGNFLVGKVVEAGKHPNADRLQLCRVDVGEGEPRQIVCGASAPGRSAPGSATATVAPAPKFQAPQTIWRGSASPTSTRQSCNRSAFGCLPASTTLPTR